jgi:hypothetical protein
MAATKVCNECAVGGGHALADKAKAGLYRGREILVDCLTPLGAVVGQLCCVVGVDANRGEVFPDLAAPREPRAVADRATEGMACEGEYWGSGGVVNAHPEGRASGAATTVCVGVCASGSADFFQSLLS